MSVTFYDPMNPLKYDEDFNIIGGGPEANFSNVNARLILKTMGIEDEVMCGAMPATDMLEVLDRAASGVAFFCTNEYSHYLQNALERIRNIAQVAAVKNGEVCWG
jgi:hypothetical protein